MKSISKFSSDEGGEASWIEWFGVEEVDGEWDRLGEGDCLSGEGEVVELEDEARGWVEVEVE